MENLEFDKYLNIDPDNLDNELINQPKYYFQVSKALSKINKELDLATENLKFTRAEKAADIRDAYYQHNSKSASVKHVEDEVEKDTEIRALELQRIELKEKSAILFGLLKAMEHKKDSLKSLSWSTYKVSEIT